MARREVTRLERMSVMSPEATVVRNYLDTLLALPWKKKSRDRVDPAHVQARLDADHYGLEKVKERIVEFLAVYKLTRRPQGTILCLVGPPGVGKTSLGRSIAESMGKKFVRISLGGVRDESEIRGHRRTYIGSKPGRIIESLRKAGTRNPVFLLDEIDKMGADFRGDPAAALLEVLDPEQNSTFSDHYLEVEFDLSQVMFITTANSLHSIPPALEDRMEIIRLPGYLEHEKRTIAERFLAPRQMKRNGVARWPGGFKNSAFQAIIDGYTREAGVRSLEREIAGICRKVARHHAETGKWPAAVTAANLEKYLGIPKYRRRVVERQPEIGVVVGLAWTMVGGEILEVEVNSVPGAGKITITGNLKDVMKESAETALSYARGLCREMSGRMVQEEPDPPARARGRGAQGRTQRRHRHGHGHRLAAAGRAGARRRRHDRRGHAAREGAAHRRPAREGRGGDPGRVPAPDHPEGKREGLPGTGAGDPARPDRPPGRDHGRSAAAGPGGRRQARDVRAQRPRAARPQGQVAGASQLNGGGPVHVEFVTSTPDLRGRPEVVLPEFAFMGRSNCGKSSLINHFLNRRDLARTSGKPGKTRLLNYFIVDGRYYLVDLPGYGFAKVSKDAARGLAAPVPGLPGGR